MGEFARPSRLLQGQGKRVSMVATDVYRPAAIDQLVTLGKRIEVPVFEMGTDAKPDDIAAAGVRQAHKVLSKIRYIYLYIYVCIIPYIAMGDDHAFRHCIEATPEELAAAGRRQARKVKRI